jgi:hypothetical protein
MQLSDVLIELCTFDRKQSFADSIAQLSATPFQRGRRHTEFGCNFKLLLVSLKAFADEIQKSPVFITDHAITSGYYSLRSEYHYHTHNTIIHAVVNTFFRKKLKNFPVVDTINNEVSNAC